ncbi:hypothetical protein [Rhodococcus sp. NPDC049939]|uniref:hypothetical protein n=1 Tax=Rhodococcus sp. NPDC049939 TaxID=3155511 RepID=UPI0033EA97C1
MKNTFSWFGAFLVLAFILSFWKLIVAAAIIAGLVWAGVAFGIPWWQRRQRAAVDRRNGETARRSALRARADIQHQQYLAGEDRGIYGEFPPAPLS